MAGAMVVVHSGQPQGIARQRIEITPGKALRPARPAERDHALQHPGKRPLGGLWCWAHGDCAGDVGGAVEILPAAVDQQELPRRHRTVGPLGHPVMHNGPMWARAADRVKADFAQGIVGAAEIFQRAHDVNLGEAALRRLGIEPGEEFHHRRAVAQMRGLHARHFGGILAGFGQDAGVFGGTDLNLSRPQDLFHRQRRAGRIDPHRTRQRREGSGEIRHRGQRHLRPQMRAQLCVKFRGIGKKLQAPVVAQNPEGLHHRIAGNVAAPDVQQPAKRIRQAEHRRLLPRMGHIRRQARAFGGTAFACKFQRMHAGRGGGRRGAFGPDPVHQIGNRRQRHARAVERGFNRRDLGGGVQPRVKAHASPLGQGLAQPGAGLDLGPGHGGELGRNLILDLHPVAPVDEHPGPVGQRDAEPRRAGKAGQPGEALIAGGDIFALMRIGAGDEEPRQLFRHQFAAQRGQPGRTILRPGGGVKALIHQLAFRMPLKRARARGSESNRLANCSVIAPASCSTSVMVTAR